MIFRFMLVPMAIAAAAVTSPALAQDMSPPSQIDRDTCAKEFASLRKEAEDHGKLFKVERNAPPEETCQRIRTYEQAEFRMLKYAEDNATKCGIQRKSSQPIAVRPPEYFGRANEGLCGGADPYRPVGDFDNISIIR